MTKANQQGHHRLDGFFLTCDVGHSIAWVFPAISTHNCKDARLSLTASKIGEDGFVARVNASAWICAFAIRACVESIHYEALHGYVYHQFPYTPFFGAQPAQKTAKAKLSCSNTESGCNFERQGVVRTLLVWVTLSARGQNTTMCTSFFLLNHP